MKEIFHHTVTCRHCSFIFYYFGFTAAIRGPCGCLRDEAKTKTKQTNGLCF